LNVRISRIIAACGILALCALSSDRAGAVVTATWRVGEYKAFDKGEADGAFITSLGEIKPGWKTEKVDLEFENPWSAVRDSSGTVYIGSDNEGTIYQVRDKKVSKLAQIEDAVAVVSLALDRSGNLFAGTMPAGQVWRISKKGKKKKLATLAKAETVWALRCDAAGKNLYAGTGPEGLLYRIDPQSGKTTSIFDSDDKRIMSLAASSDGAIWMGTSDNALVFRYNPKTGKTRALADFAGNEVSSLVEWQGTIIAAANDLDPKSSAGLMSKEAIEKAKKKKPEGQAAKMPAKGSKPGADSKAPTGTEPKRKSARKGKGALFRIRGDGHLTQLHALTDTYFTSIAVNKRGQIFAGAADKGRIYLVDTDDSVSTALDVAERYVDQVMLTRSGTIAFTTGDAATLHQTSGVSSNAIYTSDVLDAKTPAKFGRLVWHGTGKLQLETRSGNIAKPGPGWSGWQAPTSLLPGGGDSVRGKVSSPPGRYFQYRVRFGGDDQAVLRDTTLYYLPANQPTRITAVEIKPKSESKSLVTLQSGAAKPRSPLLKLKWTVENLDKDDSEYTLSVRREGEVRWRKIVTGSKPLTSKEYEWNTETYPDGYYRLRVTASDRRANTSRRSLDNHWTTSLFAVDNQRPSVTGLSVKYPAASARATDALSTISEVAFSIDDGRWQVGAAQDGIFDDQSEFLELELPRDLRSGVHTLAVRVADSAGNVGSATTSFRVP
jgi:WD40 repeat protein